MSSTEIALRDAAAPALAVTERDIVDGWVSVVRDVGELADYIAQTDFVPKALRGKPAAIAACILTGREMGIGPMASLKSIHMVQGVPSLSAEYKRARAMAGGHEIVYEETNTSRCVVRGRRKGSDAWHTVTWTIDDAKRAKLAGKDVWQQHPRRLLQARATGELCDLLFPDTSLGLATTEVLEDDGPDAGVIAMVAAGAAAETEAPKAKTAQRASRRRQAAERPTPAAPAAASASTAAPASETTAPAADQPPLPGEDEPPPDDSRHRKLVGIVQQHFKRLGFGGDERDQRLAITATIAGTPPIESTNDLGDEKLSAVADTLARVRDRDRLIALLAESSQDADGEVADA